MGLTTNITRLICLIVEASHIEESPILLAHSRWTFPDDGGCQSRDPTQIQWAGSLRGLRAFLHRVICMNQPANGGEVIAYRAN